ELTKIFAQLRILGFSVPVRDHDRLLDLVGLSTRCFVGLQHRKIQMLFDTVSLEGLPTGLTRVRVDYADQNIVERYELSEFVCEALDHRATVLTAGGDSARCIQQRLVSMNRRFRECLN